MQEKPRCAPDAPFLMRLFVYHSSPTAQNFNASQVLAMMRQPPFSKHHAMLWATGSHRLADVFKEAFRLVPAAILSHKVTLHIQRPNRMRQQSSHRTPFSNIYTLTISNTWPSSVPTVLRSDVLQQTLSAMGIVPGDVVTVAHYGTARFVEQTMTEKRAQGVGLG